MKKNLCHMKKAICSLFVVLVLLTSVFGIHAQNMFRKVSDFDGDGKADFAITRIENGLRYWWIWQTTAGVKVQQWGLASDRPAASDYDGDGKTDIAVWRPNTTNGNSSTYYILESQTNTLRHKSFFAFINSVMMHQDYNGDGKTDPGTMTGEIVITMSVNYSGSESGFEVGLPQQSLGIRVGDMDGDGRADLSSFTYNGQNLGNLITIRNLVTNASRTFRFGLLTDQYQMADFDGDGIGDLTVWRPTDGTWWWIRSSDGKVQVEQWGKEGDTPVPADYDGDGKTDLAIYRRGSNVSQPSYYWINGSQSGVRVYQWGASSDLSVTY